MPSVRLLSGAHVDRLLPMAECIAAMADAFTALARDRVRLPLRTVIRLRDGRGAFAAMPAALDEPSAFGLKAISVFPGNEGTPWDSHQGVVLLFEPERGSLAAVMDASRLTAIRTAAVSGLATRLLARPDAGDLAILGTGVQALTHLEAMRAVRRLRRVRVWSRSPANVRAFLLRAGSPEVPVEPAESAEAAVTGADLICTVTASRQPVLLGDWIAPGCHINAVGSSVAEARELDTRAVARARLYVDRRESALAEAGDFLIPRSEGAITNQHIAGELGEVLIHRVAGRGSAEEITLFKSLGLAIQDLAAADLVYRKAREQDVGPLINLGGGPDAPA